MAEQEPSRSDFEHLSRAVDKLTLTLERLPEAMAETYVRKDVFQKTQELHDKTHVEQRDDIDNLLSAKQWIVRIAGGVLVSSAVVSLVVDRIGSL
jgi:hypothetical protein